MYQSYFENTLFTSQLVKDTSLTNCGYYRDDYEFIELINNKDNIIKNKNCFLRQQNIDESRWCELSGRIHVPFFSTKTHLLNNIGIDLEFKRTTPEFFVMNVAYNKDPKNLKSYRVEIRNPVLQVRRYIVKSVVLNAIREVLIKNPMPYEFPDVS